MLKMVPSSQGECLSNIYMGEFFYATVDTLVRYEVQEVAVVLHANQIQIIVGP